MSRWTDLLMPHLLLAPILLPMLTGGLMLLMKEEHRRTKLVLNIASTSLGLVIAVALLMWVKRADASASIGVYLPGNWAAPFGIVLALDRLSAMMLLLGSLLGLASIVFAAARWHRAGVHYHPLFQFQLMGLSGAFLTADLFNLFVFFEIMLSASYGLLLHGSGRARVQSGLHYIAINLAASSLFLIGVSMLYGITGTLNMADMAVKIAQVSDADRGMLHAGAAILGVAFLAKAALWPLNFWLVPAYGAATAPVGAVFAIMTKVGVYIVLRLSTLLFGVDAGASAHFGGVWLVVGGLLTLGFGAVGMLGSQRLAHLGGFAVIASSGTLLAATGMGNAGLTAGALYYLFSSTLAASALFLLVDLVERWRNDGASTAAYAQLGDAPYLSADLEPLTEEDFEKDDDVLVGRAIPGAVAFLGLAFMACTLLVAGLPPLSGFIGKFAMLSALFSPAATTPPSTVDATKWAFMAMLIVSGLLALVAFSRAGIRHFWAAQRSTVPRLNLLEGAPVAALLLGCAVITVQAGPVMRYTEATARALHDPRNYIDAVTLARPKSYPTQASEPEKAAARHGGVEKAETP
jgi:multicomponent K+:H+ antiporter subunit D